MDTNYGHSYSHLNTSTAICWTIFLMMVDLVVYGWILPVVGAKLSGVFTIILGLDPLTELMLVIVTVFTLIFGTFYVNLEVRFWKHLFAQDHGYKWVLQVRDVLNLLVIVYNFSQLYNAVKDMISDKQMKEEFLGQGISYYTLKSLSDFGLPISESLLKSYLPRTARVDLSSWTHVSIFDDTDAKFVHGAQFVLAVAGLTASITKLVYFNTLYTYLRAMEIFENMHDPVLSDDEDAVSDYISDFSISVTRPKDTLTKQKSQEILRRRR